MKAAKKTAKPAKRAKKRAMPKQPPGKKGRPTIFTQAIADEICDRLGKGEPMAHICKDSHMPSVVAVWEKTQKDPAFSVSIARARDFGYDALADQALEIADDERHDWRMSQKGEITDEVAIARARLRIDTRLKLVAKWNPKKYGDKLDLTTRDETPPITREAMIDNLRRSPSFLASIKSMVAEAEASLK
jgi:hypothetical protein